MECEYGCQNVFKILLWKKNETRATPLQLLLPIRWRHLSSSSQKLPLYAIEHYELYTNCSICHMQLRVEK